MMYRLKQLIVLTALVMPSLGHAIIIGSTTAVSLQPSINFPAADTDNYMSGFAWFKNGFTLEDATTTCSYDSVYPVSGTVALNGGTLKLNQDLIFRDITTLQSLGTVVGNGHYVDFCTSIQGFPATRNTFQDGVLFINSDFIITSSLVFRGNCLFNGNGNSLVLGDGGYIVVEPGSQVVFENVILQNVHDRNMQCVDDTASIVLEGVRVVQTGDYNFSYGSMQFVDQVDWVGSYTFIYDSSQTSTIMGTSQLNVADGIYFSIGRYQDAASVEPLAFIDQSSHLHLENCTMSINAHGARFTKGRFEVDRDVTIEVNSTSDATAAVLGDGTPANNIMFELFPACTINFAKGLIIFDVTELDIIESRASSATIIKGAASIFKINQNIVLSNVTIEQENGAQTIVADGKTQLFKNVIIKLPIGSILLNGYSASATVNLLNGGQTINVISGVLPLGTLVSNAGNIMSGSGTIDGPIVLQDSNAQLIWALNGSLLEPIVMNGGSLILANDMTLGNGAYLSGASTVHVGNRIFNFGNTDLTVADPTYWDGSNDGINMFSNITLENTWTFSGQCTLDGNGHSLDLTNGDIIVEAGSTLVISDITLNNVSGNKIRCLDGAATIILDNVAWVQDGDLTFTTGSIQIKNNVSFHGDAIFAYQSQSVSTLLANATMTLDAGFTFSYDTGTSADLLQLTNKKSSIMLNEGSRLHATLQGLNLKKGSLVIQENSSLSSEKITYYDQLLETDVTIDNGITVGDCVSALNDTIFNVAGGVTVSFTSGSFNYKNVNGNSFILGNAATAFYVATDTALNSYKFMNMGNSVTTFADNAILGQAPSAPFTGSIATQGVLNTPTLADC